MQLLLPIKLRRSLTGHIPLEHIHLKEWFHNNPRVPMDLPDLTPLLPWFQISVYHQYQAVGQVIGSRASGTAVNIIQGLALGYKSCLESTQSMQCRDLYILFGWMRKIGKDQIKDGKATTSNSYWPVCLFNYAYMVWLYNLCSLCVCI